MKIGKIIKMNGHVHLASGGTQGAELINGHAISGAEVSFEVQDVFGGRTVICFDSHEELSRAISIFSNALKDADK